MGDVSTFAIRPISMVRRRCEFDVSVIAPDSFTGYIFEVDLEYPQNLHDILTYLSAQRAITRPASAKINF